MAVKIRFARVGKKHAPIYRIVAIDSRKKRDGMCLENLGTYNPKTKQIVQFHDDRIAHWVSLGAIPSDSVARLMKVYRKQNSVAAEVKESAPVAEKTVKKVTVKKEAAVKKTETKATKSKAA